MTEAVILLVLIFASYRITDLLEIMDSRFAVMREELTDIREAVDEMDTYPADEGWDREDD